MAIGTNLVESMCSIALKSEDSIIGIKFGERQWYNIAAAGSGHAPGFENSLQDFLHRLHALKSYLLNPSVVFLLFMALQTA